MRRAVCCGPAVAGQLPGRPCPPPAHLHPTSRHGAIAYCAPSSKADFTLAIEETTSTSHDVHVVMAVDEQSLAQQQKLSAAPPQQFDYLSNSSTLAAEVMAEETATSSMDAELTAATSRPARRSTPVLQMDKSWTGGMTASFSEDDSTDSVRSRPLFPTINMQQLLEDLVGEPKSMPAYLQGLESLNAEGGVSGPVMYRPHVPRAPQDMDPSKLPLLVYLPGIDGTGLAAYRQFPHITKVFDLRALYIPPSDRSSFEDIVSAAKTQLEAELQGGDPHRPVYLLGESFGGLVALALAQRTNAVDRIILCNPATSFSDSVWPLAGPLLTSLPSNVYNMMPIVLSPVLTNPLAIALGNLPANSSGLPPNPLDVVSSAAWGLVGLLPELGTLRSVMPPATLAHRLQLLREGSLTVNPTLHKVQQRILLLVGEKDLVIPSDKEGPRLKRALPRCQLRVLPDRSHAMLQEPGLDLAAIVQEEGFYVPRRQLTSPPRKSGEDVVPESGVTFGKALPLELPTPQEVQRAMDEGGITLLKRLVSPVYFSTDPDTGNIMRGLRHVPVGRPGRPVLLVGNHQLFAPDMPLMVAAFIQERGVLVRGLAHPMALEGPARKTSETTPSASESNLSLPFLQLAPPRRPANANEGGNPFGAFLKSFGGVKVSGTNLYKLLEAGETALLYPGGVREAYKYKGENYQLFWPDKSEFVRMVARFEGALIVPFGAVGAEDGVNQVLDGKELLELPVIGEWLRSQQQGIPQARQGVNADTKDPAFVAPLITPKAPHRFYYYFGKPIEVGSAVLKDRELADQVYAEVKNTCNSCIEYLLRKREEDPYKDLLQRLVYEASWGGQKQAPTFELDE